MILVMVGLRSTYQYFQKPGRNQILLIRTIEKNLRNFRFRCGPERMKMWRFSWRGGWVEKELARLKAWWKQGSDLMKRSDWKRERWERYQKKL